MFSKRQQDLISQYLNLENKYGYGTILIQKCSEYYTFVFHISGRSKSKILSEGRIDSGLLASLRILGMLELVDINHNKVKEESKGFGERMVFLRKLQKIENIGKIPYILHTRYMKG